MVRYPSKDSDEALESINLIQEQTDYISKIVSDLQDYARPLKPEFETIKLSALVTSVFQTINIPEKITVVVDIQGFPEIKTDPTFIKRVLTNLTNNAIQSMPNGGKLTLTAYKKAEEVTITVSDTGKGIPNDVKPRIFTPLVTTKAKGQGLGLAVVKRLVEALHGNVSFESEEGKGTMFIVKLPA
jgi:signal transduction histidine kinase